MDDALLVEVALHDTNNQEVIMALDRLIMLPTTKDQLAAAVKDLDTVQGFIDRLPVQIQQAAKAMFIEHGRTIAAHFRTSQGAPTQG